MKKLIKGIIFGMFLVKLSNMAVACDYESMNNPRALDIDVAQTIMAHFVMQIVMDPQGVYELPLDSDNMPQMSVKKPGISTEKYQLINYMSFNDANQGNPQYWWLFIPLSLVQEFQDLRTDLTQMVAERRRCDMPSVLNDFMDPVKQSFGIWMVQDNFVRSVKYYRESHSVQFISLYSKDFNRVVYLGTSFSQPSWMIKDPETDENAFDFSDSECSSPLQSAEANSGSRLKKSAESEVFNDINSTKIA